MRERLLRQALESKKVASRKQRSGRTSANSSLAVSPAGSRSHSRVASREGSDDEDAALSESVAGSTGSIDGILSASDDEMEGNWEAELRERITRISDRTRKGGSAAGRVEDLAWFVSLVRARFVKDQIAPQIEALYTALSAYLKSSAGEIEQLLAIEAISVVTITDILQSEGMAYGMCGKLLQNLATNVSSIAVKDTAIRCLALLAFLSASDDESEENVMPYLQEIIESDGVHIAAEESGEVVAAAIQSWALLATLLEDAEMVTAEAMPALVDQLDSGDTAVQVAAGEAIALLYEKSYTELEDGETGQDVLERGKGVPPLVKRYDVYRRKDRLMANLEALTNISTKSRNKKERKELKSTFMDIYSSVEVPGRGPGYSTALDKDSYEEFGSRIKLKLAGDTIVYDRWSMLIRLQAIRRWLRGGFAEHYRHNDTLRDIMTD